jgi:hypothetical protein
MSAWSPIYGFDPFSQKIDVTRTFDIGFNGLLNGLAFTQVLHDNPGTYDYRANNCVQKVISASAAAGIALPVEWLPENLGWDLYLSR